MEAEALSAEMLDVVREEEALLARVEGAIEAARARRARAASPDGMRSVDALRALRDEAAVAAEDDLPALLHEMSLRQRLLERPDGEPIPDPSSPYLAHLRVRDDRGRRDYLLGRASLVDAEAGVRIIDWREAPAARIFYLYREGDAYDETFPGREVEGVVEARRVVVIEDGALVRVLGDGFVLERDPSGAWSCGSRAAWSFRGGAGEGGVTALLDAKQFAAVEAPDDEPLVVLGSAGSGKTTVALHRLARLAATRRIPMERMAVIVPEEGLARLSARLLASLGCSASVNTLDAWSLARAREIFGRTLPPRCAEAPALVQSLKRSPALFDALTARFARKPKGAASAKRVWRTLAGLYTDRPFLHEVVAASNGALSRAAVEETVRHTLLQLAEPVDRQLASIVVPEMKEAVDGRAIAEGTPDELAGTIDVEDLPILLYLRVLAGAGVGAPAFAHLVLDEAEDFSLFELSVLGALLGEGRGVTLAGDEAQQTTSSFAGWPRALAALGVGEATTRRLAISYRCPRPVVELAARILGAMAPEELAAARDGAPVSAFAFPDEAGAQVFLAGALRDIVDREPRASIAVIARDAATAARLHALVAAGAAARLVLRGEFSFAPGIDVTAVDQAKGLEFDYVVIPDATADAYPATDEARRRLHVAVTRASHELWIVAGGAPSPVAASSDR